MRQFAPALVAGVVSALLYVIVSAFGLGFMFLFLPTLPILWLGLSTPSPQGLLAGIFGTLALAILMVPPSGLFVYFIGLAIPAWHIAHESLRRGEAHNLTVWFPLTVIFSRLSTGFVFILLGFSLFFGGQEGGISAMLEPGLKAATEHFSTELEGDKAEAIRAALPSLSFLIFAVSAWMWGLCLYLHAWVTNRELMRQNKNLRPNLAVDPLPPPNWMISLLIISAIATILGSPALAFWGKTSLVVLLFPYFLFAMALIHTRTRNSNNRTSILFFLYFLLGIVIWPILLVAAYGVICHLKMLNKYLSAR